jgi:hypothetical protein
MMSAGCCAAVLSTPVLGTSAARPASTSIRTFVTGTAGFEWWCPYSAERSEAIPLDAVSLTSESLTICPQEIPACSAIAMKLQR